MVIFQYNLYIFVWIEHGCLTNTVYVMDPNNSVIKRSWCIHTVHVTGLIPYIIKIKKVKNSKYSLIMHIPSCHVIWKKEDEDIRLFNP